MYFATPPVRTHREKADYLRSRGHLLELGYDIHLSTTVLHRLVADSSNARWAASTKRAQRYHKGYYFTGGGRLPPRGQGEGICAYVTLMIGDDRDPQELLGELIDSVRTEIGPIAKPDIIQWAPGLPKTRSGKIMRRLLRKIASDELDSLGDTSTLADPSVVEELIANRQNR